MVVGGFYYNGHRYLSSTELFPRPPSDTCSQCSIPDLPQPRVYHTLSLLSGGRLVVCGGTDPANSHRNFRSCISWVAGNSSWTTLYTLRCLPINHLYQTQSQCDERWSHGMDAAISSRLHCPAGWLLLGRTKIHCRHCTR